MPANSKKENYIFYGLGLAAILVYSWTIFTHAINMPKGDDFPDILQFMDRWLSASNPAEKISVFFYHTNEHILLVNHVVILIQYYLLGHLNFSWLIYAGNLFYIGSALVLWLPFKNTGESALAFTVLILTAVTFYPYESTLWAMTAISNQAVIFFSLLTLWYATRPSFQTFKIVPLATLAIFSQSNGFFLLPLVMIIVFFFHKEKLVPWLIFCGVIIAFYSFIFNPASQQDASTNWSNLSISHYLMTIPIFIATFGSTLFNEASITNLIFASLTGAIILMLSLKQILARQHSRFILFVLLFLWLSIASIAFYRGLIGGPTITFISRYKMYGACFLAVGLLLSPQWLAAYRASRLMRYGVVIFSALFFIASFYLNLPKSTLIDSHLRESLEHWVEDGDFRRGKGFFIKDSDSYLFTALHRGIWSPLMLIQPDRIISHITSLDSCPANADATDDVSPLHLGIRHINRNAPGIRLEISPEASHLASEWSIYLCATGANYRLRFTPRQDANGIYSIYYIPSAHIAPGSYKVFVEYGGRLMVTSQTLLRKPHTR